MQKATKGGPVGNSEDHKYYSKAFGFPLKVVGQSCYFLPHPSLLFFRDHSIILVAIYRVDLETDCENVSTLVEIIYK